MGRRSALQDMKDCNCEMCLIALVAGILLCARSRMNRLGANGQERGKGNGVKKREENGEGEKKKNLTWMV